MSDASAKTSRREIRRAFGGAAIDTLNTHDAQLASITRLLQHAIARIDQQDSQLRQLTRDLKAADDRLNGFMRMPLVEKWRWMVETHRA